MNKEKRIEHWIGHIISGTEFEGKVFSVGGFVRDELLEVESKDLDIVVEMDGGANKLAHFLSFSFNGGAVEGDKCTNPYNLGNGYPIWQLTFKVEGDDVVVEFADTQSESFPDPESRQRVTVFGTLEEDIMRRDFTCNMLIRDLSTGEIRDTSGGVKDIENKVLTHHPEVDPNKMLSDDPLRIMRAIRQKCQFPGDWKISNRLKDAIINQKQRLSIISQERITSELIKIMKIGKLHDAIELMDELGVLEIIFPEVVKMKNVFHDLDAPFHKECDGEVFGHVMLVLKHAKSGVINQLSALFHDIGKPRARKVDPETGRVRFKYHEPIGADMTVDILKRMKFDNTTVKLVSKLVKMHTRPHAFGRWGEGSNKALRKLIRDAGEDLDLLLNLSEADCLGNDPVHNNVPEVRRMVAEILAEPVKVSSKPILNGKEIMELRGMKKGTAIIKDIMSGLLDLSDDKASKGSQLTKEEAEEFVKGFK